MLSDMFGANAVSPLIRGERLTVTVEQNDIHVDLSTLVSTLWDAGYGTVALSFHPIFIISILF